MMPPSVVFVGAATYDAIAVVEHMPAPDGRQLASDIRYAGGGPAATAAVAAHRLGLDVDLIAAVGADAVGELIRESLVTEGIDDLHLQVEPDRASQGSVILCSEAAATRSIATLEVSALHLNAAGQKLVRDAQWIHVDHLGWPAVVEALAEVPLEDRPFISVDAGHSPVGPSASSCNVADVELYVPPIEKLVEQYGERPADEILRAIPARTVVATLGSRGSIGRGHDGAVHSAPAFSATIGSTLGAGDVFHGALVSAVVHGLPLAEALAYANAVASLSCRGVDGRSGIPSHDETIAYIRKERQ